MAEQWITSHFWVTFGVVAQGMFFGRFLLQWIVSEKRKQSVIPVGFWWLSIMGSTMLLAYAIHRRDPVFVLGQSMGFIIYIRNLVLIYRHRPSAATNP